MRERNCGPRFAWAFGMRPENVGFDAGTFWGGRGKSRGGPFGGGRMFDQGHLKFVILRLLDEKPRHGAHGTRIAFIHPKSSNGVLTELCQAG